LACLSFAFIGPILCPKLDKFIRAFRTSIIVPGKANMSTWLRRGLSWRNRAILLTVLTVNDFRLHLESLLDVWWRDPTFSPFHWIYLQGLPIYDEFWSVYWGLGFATALSLVVWDQKTKGTNTPTPSSK
jgi:hypothetical protein